MAASFIEDSSAYVYSQLTFRTLTRFISVFFKICIDQQHAAVKNRIFCIAQYHMLEFFRKWVHPVCLALPTCRTPTLFMLHPKNYAVQKTYYLHCSMLLINTVFFKIAPKTRQNTSIITTLLMLQ